MCGFQLSVESDQAINLVVFFFGMAEQSNMELIDVVLVFMTLNCKPLYDITHGYKAINTIFVRTSIYGVRLAVLISF